MRETEKTFPVSEYIERFDGSKWRIFYLSSGIVVLTSSGQELLENLYGRTLLSLLRMYRKDAEVNTSNVRHYFRSGGNSDVYDLDGKPIVIKETIRGTSAWSSLDRMDKLYWLCESFLSPLVRVPKHYALVSSRQLPREYLIMEKANKGITVEEAREMSLYHQYTDLINGLVAKVRAEILQLSKTYFPEENLLPDYHEGNIIIDFDAPVSQNIPFSLWIIDQ